MRNKFVLALLSACVIFFSIPNQKTIADEAEYRLTFSGAWTLQPLPGGAHFSPLVGATHRQAGAIFSVGGSATIGVENVAEIGSTSALQTEINDGIAAGDMESLLLRPGNIGPEQDVTIEFSVTTEHSLLTLLTMIAPSPDWFVAVHDFDLRPEGIWVEEVTLELNSYDAGTEDGSDYSISNSATVPQQMIVALDAASPDGPLFGFGSVASVTLTRVDVDLFTLGDINNDGAVTLLDVSGFVALVSTQTFLPAADINCDNVVDFLDVGPFVDLLSN